VVAALAASHKIGLALVAGCFIVFALVSALWLPRLRPNFPGPGGLRAYIAVVVAFAAGTLVAVALLAAEPKEKAQAAQAPSTQTAPSSTKAPAPAGNAAAGQQLFAAQGCGACHTFTKAKATGTIGPNLDHLASDAQKAGRGTEQQYAFESIQDPNAYVVPGYPASVMPNFGQRLSRSQIADLVAFLTR
jgi:mono/diheme cytochrome c family protein